jgi:molecular chaperone HtpG
MVPEGAFEIISADDLSALLLACLVHDSGLHITEGVFLALTEESNSKIVIPELDEKPWPELWTDFLAEAQRFSAKKLVSLFGDAEPVRDPPRSAIEMSQRDRLLIGEFLRRHHPRFGHEFIVGGVPDARRGKFEFPEIETRTKDIVGLIARSHGLDLRSTFDYIQKHYDLRDYNRIHIVYLMVLIRVADYLQIQSARAPNFFGRIHAIKSPFSLGEWKLHQSIENITTSAMDPEAVSVLANPKSVHDYLRFESWMRGFQTEIDKSWAILGEVYGRFTREALNKLQLNIRRIRSNIEDKAALQKKAGFVPEPIRFTVSEPELLRLLMEPLYGENPTYGLRELTQNAADSVNELEHAIQRTAPFALDRADLNHDIEVEIVGDPDWSFTIRDRGTGMTLETIKNYFLKAGASFRNSELWKQDFTDSTGKSQVARTGRFGVGALSAYLIGEKVQIFTSRLLKNLVLERFS